MRVRPRHLSAFRCLGVVVLLRVDVAFAQEHGAEPSRAQPFELSKIVIHGEHRVASFEDQRATQVVEEKAIERSGSTSLPDVVRQTPGLSVQQTTPGQGTIYLRGLSGRAVGHSVDGVRLNTAFFRAGNNPYLGLIDPYSLTQITSVPGAAAVEYGSDALGGALLFSTGLPDYSREASEDTVSVLQVLSTNPLGSISHADWTHASRQVAFKIGLSYTGLGDVRPGGRQTTPDPSSYPGLTRNGVHVPYEPDTQISQKGTGFSFVAANATMRAKLGFFDLVARAQLGVRPELVRYDRITPRFKRDVPSRYTATVSPMTRQMVSLHLAHSDTEGVVRASEFMLAWQRIREQKQSRGYDELCLPERDADVADCAGALQLVPSAVEDREVNRSDSFSARYLVTLVPARALTLGAGIELHSDLITSSGEQYHIASGVARSKMARYPSGSSANEGGIFIKGELEKGPFRLIGGVRGMGFFLDIQSREVASSFTRTLFDYSAELGARLELGRPVALVANAGRGVRMPNVADLSGLGPRAKGRYQVPNSNIGPEHSWTVDAGVKLREQGFQLDTFVFATRYSDAIVLLPTKVEGEEFTADGERFYHSENAARVDYLGIDVSGAVPLGELARLRGRWLAMQGRQTNPPGTGAPRSTPADRVPPYQGELGIDCFPTERLDFSLWARLRFKQERLNDPVNLDDNRIPEGGTPGYVTLHARAGYALSQVVSGFVRFDNWTNSLVLDHGSGFYGPGFSASIGLQISRN